MNNVSSQVTVDFINNNNNNNNNNNIIIIIIIIYPAKMNQLV